MAEPLQELTGRLHDLSPQEAPLAALWSRIGSRRLTYRLFLECRQVLDDYAGQSNRESRRYAEVIQRCQQLQPIPLPHLPLGF